MRLNPKDKNIVEAHRLNRNKHLAIIAVALLEIGLFMKILFF